ncbi:MAG: ABC transporter substrate-binding protein [Synergistaceae bacterium]|jgi:branched-chain amino acid transport system substrate-binding protein|nr:ABC transporter substrate-binding protein [Synergistaceae bacterium]
MFRIRPMYSLFLIVVMAFVMAVPAEAADTVKLGWYGPVSGAAAQDGQEGRNGAELAMEMINAAGGIGGKMLEIVFADDKSDPKEGANIATMFVSDGSIIGVSGPFNSSVMLAAAPIYNRGKLADVGWGVTSPMITTAGDYIYRVQATDALEGDFMSRWILDEGFKKVAIVYENTDYGVGVRDVVRASVAKYGGEIVTEANYVQGQTKDFGSIIASLKQAAPDAVMTGSIYNEGALIISQARDLGFDAPFFGTDGFFSSGLLELGGAAVEGARCCSVFYHEVTSPKVREFIDAYTKKTGKTPGTWAALSYDSINVFAEVIKKTGAGTREEIKKGLDELGSWEGATGVMEFDENGDVNKTLNKLIVKDGKFAIYQK